MKKELLSPSKFYSLEKAQEKYKAAKNLYKYRKRVRQNSFTRIPRMHGGIAVGLSRTVGPNWYIAREKEVYAKLALKTAKKN